MAKQNRGKRSRIKHNMFSLSKKRQARRGLRAVIRNPYTQKTLHDPHFRKHALEALVAGKQAYRRFNKKGSGVLDDRKFKRSVKDARSSLLAAQVNGRSGKGKWVVTAAVLGAGGWLWSRVRGRSSSTKSNTAPKD